MCTHVRIPIVPLQKRAGKELREKILKQKRGPNRGPSGAAKGVADKLSWEACFSSQIGKFCSRFV